MNCFSSTLIWTIYCQQKRNSSDLAAEIWFNQQLDSAQIKLEVGSEYMASKHRLYTVCVYVVFKSPYMLMPISPAL